MTKTRTIDWKPFSDKHKQYMRSALNNRMCVAEGAIRSGKTIDHCIIARRYLEYCKDKIHLATGSTLGNAKLNIGDCNGFGLEHQFRGRCQWGKYKGNECLKIKTKTGEKIVIFAGGKNADSYKKILGNSYGLWIATEINEHYDDEDSRKSFIKVAFGRQAAAEQPFVLWDLNPCAPTHEIYENYIDKYKETYVGGYQYEHFTIADNLAISAQRRREIESQYDVGSIWYRRDILGERCVAEGRIYTSFTRERNVIDVNEWNTVIGNNQHLNPLRDNIMICTAGIDFGGNKSATAFVLSGFTKQFQETIVLKEKYISEEITPTELERKFVNWIKECLAEYPILREVYCDSAEQVLIRGLRAAAIKERLPIAIKDAMKGSIIDRIRFGVSMFAQERFYIVSNCKKTIEAYDTALWDSNYDDERLDDGTTNIDNLDATEYSQEPYIKTMIDMTITR